MEKTTNKTTTKTKITSCCSKSSLKQIFKITSFLITKRTLVERKFWKRNANHVMLEKITSGALKQNNTKSLQKQYKNSTKTAANSK